jgi:transcriptional regulator of arginine metabolism
VLSSVLSVEASGNLCILKTKPAQAMPVARAFDQADLTEVCGTIGGDDTILLIAREPAIGTDLAALCQTLQLREVRV